MTKLENLIELRDALDFQINEWWGGLRQESYATNYRRSLMSLLKNLGYSKLPLLNSEEIGHILETQELLCELGKSNKDDGSCSLCRSIKAKLRPQGMELS